jgi:ABC-type transport system involved in multi-copper enzyme maturation permease subunit
MTALVRSELRKISSTRLWWALLIGAVIYTMIQSGANAALAGSTPGAGQPAPPGLDTAEAIRNIYVVSMFQGTYIFAMILGITGMTGEYRYQTITSTFLAEPRRARVVVAKMLAHLVAGIGFGVVGLAAAVAVGAAVIGIRGHDLGFGADRLFPTMALGVLAVALWTLLGIGIGTLIRNQIAAILIAVFVTFLVEPLATFILSRQDLDYLVKWLPTNASNALMAPGNTVLHYLEWWAGGLVLVGYAMVLAGLGIVLSVRRDIS